MLQFDVQFAPAAFLDVRSGAESDARIEGRWLVLSSGGITLRAEAATGRVVSIDRGTNLPAVDVRFNAHAWERASRDFTSRAAAMTHFYVPGHGMSSLLGFAVTELARWQLASKMSTNITAEQQACAVAALSKLVNPQYFYAVETYLGGGDPNRFGIPADDLDRAIQGNSFAAFSGFLLDFSRGYFPKYSWPWTVAREMVFNFMNLSQYTDPELQRLYQDEETGPIGCLVIASAFGKAGSPVSKTFAMEGLLRMGQRDFLRDCNLLLRGESGLARSFGRTVEALRNLPEDEVAALAAVLPEAEANLLRESAAALRAAADGPPASVLAPALGKYWEESLRGKVRRALQKLTLPPEGGPTAGI